VLPRSGPEAFIRPADPISQRPYGGEKRKGYFLFFRQIFFPAQSIQDRAQPTANAPGPDRYDQLINKQYKTWSEIG